MDLPRVERELKKRVSYPYIWGKKQDNSWDRQTNFIYQTYSVRKLLERTESLAKPLQNYALNRWYNFWSAMAVENIFCSHENVIANKDKYDKLIDFKIDDIPFDHKTSIFPKGFNKDLGYALKNKKELIEWLYENQSQEGRKHLANRLFIVLFDENKQHWRIKAEIDELKKEIEHYLENFCEDNLVKLDFGEGEVLADIIWCIR